MGAGNSYLQFKLFQIYKNQAIKAWNPNENIILVKFTEKKPLSHLTFSSELSLTWTLTFLILNDINLKSNLAYSILERPWGLQYNLDQYSEIFLR